MHKWKDATMSIESDESSTPRSLASAIHSSPKALMPSSLGSEDITMYIWRRESEAQQLVELQFAFSHF